MLEAIVGCSRELLSVIRANVLAYGVASPAAPHAAEAATLIEATQALRASRYRRLRRHRPIPWSLEHALAIPAERRISA